MCVCAVVVVVDVGTSRCCLTAETLEMEVAMHTVMVDAEAHFR